MLRLLSGSPRGRMRTRHAMELLTLSTTQPLKRMAAAAAVAIHWPGCCGSHAHEPDATTPAMVMMG